MRALQSLLLLVGVLLLVALGLLLGIDNSEAVRLAFLDWQSPALPLFAWLCLAFGLGLALGVLVAGATGVRHRVARGRMQRALDAREREVRDLRQIALED
jgi:uncharacterized membrane protein YciS (DUF1049 family)